MTSVLEEVIGSKPPPGLDPQPPKPKSRFWGRSEARKDAAVPAGRGESSPLQRRYHNGQDAPVELFLPKIAAAGLRAHEYVVTQGESPWNKFQKRYELKFDRLTTVATRKALPCELVAMKGLPKPDGHMMLEMLQRIRQKNFVSLLESFEHQDQFYVIVEHFPVSLAQIATSPPYPTELQLAAILGQILNGLAYLTLQGLVHGSLACSTVLISGTGVVKIANQKQYSKLGPSNDGKGDLKAVGRIAMELMQKYSKDDDAIGVEDLDRWPPSSKAVGFLSGTTSADSVKELLQISLAGGRVKVDGRVGWILSVQGLQVSTLVELY